jgi:hypothetical protein
MQVRRRTGRAVRLLTAFLAAAWLLQHAATADETSVHSAAKSDMLVINPKKGQPQNQQGPTGSGSAAATDAPVPELRGPAARRLIDVAIRDKGIWLNSFETRTMPLNAIGCAELSEEILLRFSLPASAVHRLAEEELMRQTRVCAVNGSLLVTCYGGAATVSLRRPHLGDGCEAYR